MQGVVVCCRALGVFDSVLQCVAVPEIGRHRAGGARPPNRRSRWESET